MPDIFRLRHFAIQLFSPSPLIHFRLLLFHAFASLTRRAVAAAVLFFDYFR